MPTDPLTLHEDFGEIDRLGAAIRAYRIASGGMLADAMIKAGKELSYNLYKETVKITPAESVILAVPRRSGWLSRKRHGRSINTKPKTSVVRQQIVTHGGINGMIQWRLRHRKFSASGWLPAFRAFVAANRGSVASTFRTLGWLDANVDEKGNAHLIIGNRAGPISTVISRKDILHKAVDGVFRGMAPYIQKKLGAQAQQIFLNLGAPQAMAAVTPFAPPDDREKIAIAG